MVRELVAGALAWRAVRDVALAEAAHTEGIFEWHGMGTARMGFGSEGYGTDGARMAFGCVQRSAGTGTPHVDEGCQAGTPK